MRYSLEFIGKFFRLNEPLVTLCVGVHVSSACGKSLENLVIALMPALLASAPCRYSAALDKLVAAQPRWCVQTGHASNASTLSGLFRFALCRNRKCYQQTNYHQHFCAGRSVQHRDDRCGNHCASPSVVCMFVLSTGEFAQNWPKRSAWVAGFVAPVTGATTGLP